MKKKSFTFACRMRCKNRNLARLRRELKKRRHRKARRSKDPKLIYKTTSAWDII